MDGHIPKVRHSMCACTKKDLGNWPIIFVTSSIFTLDRYAYVLSVSNCGHSGMQRKVTNEEGVKMIPCKQNKTNCGRNSNNFLSTNSSLLQQRSSISRTDTEVLYFFL